MGKQTVAVTSARQRVVVLTFETADDALAWDRAGQPVDVPGYGRYTARSAMIDDDGYADGAESASSRTSPSSARVKDG